MKKHLILIRHGHSIDMQPDVKDVNRTLTETGIQESFKAGKYLNTMKLKPDIIYTSSADRATGTAHLIAEQTGLEEQDVIVAEDLYEASVRILLKIINELGIKFNKVVLIGHNPSISYLCEFLTGNALGDMAPGGICIIEFDCSWKEIGKATGKLIDFRIPSDINI